MESSWLTLGPDLPQTRSQMSAQSQPGMGRVADRFAWEDPVDELAPPPDFYHGMLSPPAASSDQTPKA